MITGVGGLIAGRAIDLLVDNAISLDAAMGLVHDIAPFPLDMEQPEVAGGRLPPSKFDYRRDSINMAVFNIRRLDSDRIEYALIFRRDGLVWRLAGIRLLSAAKADMGIAPAP